MSTGMASSTGIVVNHDQAAREEPASQHRIVVGIDGSGESARAQWRHPRHRHGLDVPHGHRLGVHYHGQRRPRRARSLVDGAVSHVREVALDVIVRGETTEQSPGPALVKASKGADLLVVGSRGRGGFEELLVGSVARYCAATCLLLGGACALMVGRSFHTGPERSSCWPACGTIVSGITERSASSRLVLPRRDPS